jgi:hypothetical protein
MTHRLIPASLLTLFLLTFAGMADGSGTIAADAGSVTAAMVTTDVAAADAIASGALAATSASHDAAEPKIVRIEPHVKDGRLLINADVRFGINEVVRDAAERGVPLYFTADIVLTRSRWWWLDHTEVDTSLTLRIVYNALTRQWRAGVGELSLPTGSLDDAMDLIRHIRNWDVGSSQNLSTGVQYNGKLRVRLDTSLLPRPFQVNALNSSSWTPSTDWTPFSFSLAAPGAEHR